MTADELSPAGLARNYGQDLEWSVDLVSSDQVRRAAALQIHRQREAVFCETSRASLRLGNQRWAQRKTGKVPAALDAACDQAFAARDDARERSFLWAVNVRANSYGPPVPALDVYAIVWLEWEARFPEDWIGDWGNKKKTLARFAREMPEPHREQIADLIVLAALRDHRCEDGGYARLARALGPNTRLDDRLGRMSVTKDQNVRCRSGYLLAVRSEPGLSHNVPGWRTWTARHREVSAVTNQPS